MNEQCTNIRKRTNEGSDKLEEASNLDETGSCKRPRRVTAHHSEGCQQIIENIFAENVKSQAEIEIEYKGNESSSELISILFQHVDDNDKMQDVFGNIYNSNNSSNPNSSSMAVSDAYERLIVSNHEESVKDLEEERTLDTKSVDELCQDLIVQLQNVEGYETESWGSKLTPDQVPFYKENSMAEEDGVNDFRSFLSLSPVTEDVFLHDTKKLKHNLTNDVEDDISTISKEAEDLIYENTLPDLNCEGTEDIDFNGFGDDDNTITAQYILDLVLSPTKSAIVESNQGIDDPENLRQGKKIDHINVLEDSSLPGDDVQLDSVKEVDLMSLEVTKASKDVLLLPDNKPEPESETPLCSPDSTNSKLSNLNCTVRLRRVEEDYSETTQSIIDSSSPGKSSQSSQESVDVVKLRQNLRDKLAAWKQQQAAKNKKASILPMEQSEATILTEVSHHQNRSEFPNNPSLPPQPSTSVCETALPQNATTPILEDCNQYFPSSPMDSLKTTLSQSASQSVSSCDNKPSVQENRNFANTEKVNSKRNDKYTTRTATNPRLSSGHTLNNEKISTKKIVNKKHTQSQLIAQMKREMAKSTPDIQIVSDLLVKTFVSRNKLLHKANSTPAKILDGFPGLKLHTLIKEEFGRVLNDVSKMQTLESKLIKPINDALKLTKTKKRPGKVGEMHPLWLDASQRWEKNPKCSVELKRILGLFKFCLHFAEEHLMSSLCKIQKQGEFLDESTLVTPTIVLSEDTIFKENTSMWIYVDGEKFVEVPNFYEAVLCVYAVYYIFNIEYDKQLKAVFEFFDFLIDNPQSTFSNVEAGIFIK